MKRAFCCPVGPAGMKPPTVLTLVGLVKAGAVEEVALPESHLIPGRNAAWAEALRRECDRVLWCDADVSAPLGELAAWMSMCDAEFEREPQLGWIGPVVARRGGGWAIAPEIAEGAATLLGLGMAYWHVPRVVEALRRAKLPLDMPFRWIPPFTEDYRMCGTLAANGCLAQIDERLPTSHHDVGDWPGRTESTPKTAPCSKCGQPVPLVNDADQVHAMCEACLAG